jgi:glycosyltransferase involved in cell wall biosynthesis
MAIPLLSIIIPTLNEAHFLPLLLSDLACQSFRDFEVIIVDAHSNDQTLPLAQTFALKLPALHVLTSSVRLAAAQRNFGATHALAPWLMFCDADNQLEPQFLTLLTDHLHTPHPPDFFTTHCRPDVPNVMNRLITRWINYFIDVQKNTRQPYAIESLLIARRSSFNHLTGFPLTSVGEGSQLLHRANLARFTFTVFHQPLWVMSFRRIRERGYPSSITGATLVETSRLLHLPAKDRLLQKWYPMNLNHSPTARKN